MDINQPLSLLGGITAAQFMRRHWQKKPLLVRQAIPDFKAPVPRTELFALAGHEGVESRLVHALLQQFRFVPDARLDDLMVSYASDGGGVGPHFDSYDVFLLQAHGKRRWRIGRQKDLSLRDDVPLKILANFEPEEEYLMEPGDLLYLPPRWAHDSVGFRVPERTNLAQELLVRLADEDDADSGGTLLYRDAKQPAVAQPAQIPEDLHSFARAALERALAQPQAVERALGEYLTEPKSNVWFDTGPEGGLLEQLRLDRRTRMMYDAEHIFINGESYRASGRDAALMRQLADQRHLGREALARASDGALELLSEWCDAGWAHATDSGFKEQ